MRSRRLADWTTDELAALFAKAPPIVIVPVGSVEPHGPHLPLATDTIISEAAAARAASELEARGRPTLVAPAVPYGVTRFAEGFAGAVSVDPDALTAFLRALVGAFLRAGFAHACLVNNHLEPAHDAAVRAAAVGIEPRKVSVACPLAKRWARTLSPEFKSGACHAGQYETSLVLASAPELVDVEAAKELADVHISLSDGIRRGQSSFRAMGIDRAYTGAPKQASSEEGRDLLGLLATMIVTEIEEALARA